MLGAPPMNLFFYSEEAGPKGLPPLSPAPQSPPTLPPLRSGQFRLTIPNTYSTITMPASLRSDCCSPSLRNAVRRPSGIDVHLHRNTHKREISWQPLARTLTKLPIYVGFWSLSIAGSVSTCPTLYPQDGHTINNAEQNMHSTARPTLSLEPHLHIFRREGLFQMIPTTCHSAPRWLSRDPQSHAFP